MTRATASTVTWTDDHTTALLRGVVTTVLAARPSLYTIPELEGLNNRSNRVNKKIRQVLASLLKAYPGTENMLNEATTPRGSPTKASPAKRKNEQVKVELDAYDRSPTARRGRNGPSQSPKKRRGRAVLVDDDSEGRESSESGSMSV